MCVKSLCSLGFFVGTDGSAARIQSNAPLSSWRKLCSFPSFKNGDQTVFSNIVKRVNYLKGLPCDFSFIVLKPIIHTCRVTCSVTVVI